MDEGLVTLPVKLPWLAQSIGEGEATMNNEEGDASIGSSSEDCSSSY